MDESAAIQAAGSIHELLRAVDAIGVVVGSKESFDFAELALYTLRVIDQPGAYSLDDIARTHGLRLKVKELINPPRRDATHG